MLQILIYYFKAQKRPPISDRIWAKALCNSHTNAQQQTFPLDQFAFSETSTGENVTAFTRTSGESGKGKTLSYRYRTFCLQAFLIQPNHFPEISKWHENWKVSWTSENGCPLEMRIIWKISEVLGKTLCLPCEVHLSQKFRKMLFFSLLEISGNSTRNFLSNGKPPRFWKRPQFKTFFTFPFMVLREIKLNSVLMFRKLSYSYFLFNFISIWKTISKCSEQTREFLQL